MRIMGGVSLRDLVGLGVRLRATHPTRSSALAVLQAHSTLHHR